MLLGTLVSLVSCGKTKFEFELNEDGKSYKLVGMENAKGDVVVPESYNDLPVTKIGKGSIDDKPKMTSLVFPDSITEIEGYIFGGNLNGLMSVTIGKNVTYIADYAFSCDATLDFTTINYAGTAEQWSELCRYSQTSDGRKYTNVYNEDKITVNCDYVMP